MLAPVWVSTFGLELGEQTGWFGALRGRYFGARPLTEDGQIESHATFTVNARLGYRFDNGWKVQVDGFNILNSRADMIDYAANVFGKQDFAINPWYVGGSGRASPNAPGSRSTRRRSASRSAARSTSSTRRRSSRATDRQRKRAARRSL